METTQIAPGLTLGAQDPDNSSELTKRLGTHNKADKMLERHRANWPVALTSALARPKDELRSRALDEEEVTEALLAITGRRRFFREDDVLEGCSVRGSRPKDRVVAVVFRRPSGRIGHGVIPYEGLKKSERAYEALNAARLAAPPGTRVDDLRPTEVAAGPEANDALAAAQEARDAAERRAAEAEAQLAGITERLAALENPEPWEGYLAQKAGDRVTKIKDGGATEFGVAGLERIIAFEESQKKPSATVISAAEDAILAAQQQAD